jgi:hypothetical protein
MPGHGVALALRNAACPIAALSLSFSVPSYMHEQPLKSLFNHLSFNSSNLRLNNRHQQYCLGYSARCFLRLISSAKMKERIPVEYVEYFISICFSQAIQLIAKLLKERNDDTSAVGQDSKVTMLPTPPVSPVKVSTLKLRQADIDKICQGTVYYAIATLDRLARSE